MRIPHTYTSLAWLPFFIAPLFWARLLSSYLTIDLLCLAVGLAIAASLTRRDKDFSQWPWIFLTILTIPVALHYALGDLRAPWQEFRLYFYLVAAWLIFRMSQSYASALINSRAWGALLGIVGVFYVVFATCGMYNVRPFAGGEMFPIWTMQEHAFGGPLIQRNLESLFMALIAVTLLYHSAKDGEKPLPWLLAALLPCAAVFLSASRAAPVVLAFGLLFILLGSPYKRRILINSLGCIAVALLFALWLHTPGSETVTQRFITEPTGIQRRLFIWSMSAMLFWEHPWLGLGWGNLIAHGTDGQIALLSRFPEMQPLQVSMMRGAHSWTHNLILEFLVSAGVIGGVACLWIVGALGYRMFFALRRPGRDDGSLLGMAGAGMMLLHGMVSIALFQGFFLVLFAFYMAAVFPSRPQSEKPVRLRILYFIPALLAASFWFSLVSTQWKLEKNLSQPLKSDQFINAMSDALSNPWTHRQALRHYVGKITLEHAPGSIWVRSEPYVYALWNEFQSSIHLKFLIILAHMKSDKLMEDRLIDRFVTAFPNNPACTPLLDHKKSGHDQGKPIDVWQ